MKATYKCDLLSPSGYSKAARNQVRGMIEAGVDVRVEDRKKDPSSIEPDEFWRKNASKCINKSAEKQGVVIWHETPDFFSPLPHNYNIGCVPWETSHIPAVFLSGKARSNWVAQMNRMNEIWTAAESSKKAFEESGVKVPITVIPHPIDLEAFCPSEKVPLRNELDQPFDEVLSLLSVFQWNMRKNPVDLLNYYLATFNTYEDVRLFVKTYKQMAADTNDISFCRNEIKRIKAQLHLDKPPAIQALWSRIPEKEMPDLYQSCDAYYALPYGEGFGLPFQEAMASGKPCIYPKSSSMVDFIDDEVGYGVEVTEECVNSSTMPNNPLTPWYQATQLWWKPTFRSAEKALKKVYHDWKSGELDKKGKKARERIEKLHSFTKVGKLMKERVEYGINKIRKVKV